MDTPQWTGNSEDSNKATATQAGGEKRRAVLTICTGSKREGKSRKKKNELSLRVLYLKYLADMLSDSEVRGDDCIDRFHSLIISEKESESRPEQKMLLLQKHTINHHMQFVLNEN